MTGISRGRQSLLILLFCSSLIHPLYSQISVTSPSSRDNVKSSPDYADETLLDRWDMNERTDLGWRIYNTYELPKSYLKNITFSNGIFSAVSEETPGWTSPITSDVNVTLLDSAYPNAVVIGKTGRKYPINADRYTHLIMRMSIDLGVEEMPWGQSYLLWSKNTIYNGQTTSQPFFARNGWHFYVIDIPSLGTISGGDPWNGWIDSLRLDPISTHDKTIQIDWIRLVSNDAAGRRTISWSGSGGPVDIYLDNDASRSNGNLGSLAKAVSGSSYTFLTGGLAAGDYYVAVVPSGGDPAGSASYSAGYYHVNDTPIVLISKPSDEGSDVDFATLSFSDPWDMANSADVEYTVRVQNGSFQTINYEDLAGQAFSNQTVFYGVSEPASGTIYGDPYAYFLFPWYGKRGTTASIDTSRYHNLTFKAGIGGTYSYNDGSIARAVWKRTDETVENVCRDIVIKHFADRWLMNKITLDLATVPLEDGAGSPSHSGWTGLVNAFRLDPLEFPDAHAFFFDDVKITADWTANASFVLDYSISDWNAPLHLSLYYDGDNSGYNGTAIAVNMPVTAGTGHYTWDTGSVPAGKYWIYAVATDGVNQNSSYSTGPVIISHNQIPSISLSRNVLYFGAAAGGAGTSLEKVLITNSGLGTLNWQAAPTASWITVTPVSGTGNGAVEVGVNAAGLSAGSYSGAVVVTDSLASNSPQRITVSLTVYSSGADGQPFGVMDTPASGSNVYGSVPVTGWALDDIEVKRIEIRRAPDADDSPNIIESDGLVYIGNAVFVRGARPDVASQYPSYPRAEIAGWGYMLLTNFLPHGGNGAFRLYAVAVDSSGHRVTIGEKEIVGINSASVMPFGAIDTPSQGGLASGSAFVNFGWALTPSPSEIPRNGSTLWVWVDSVPLGHPVYNQFRQDIYDLFPGYLNRDGAVGYYYMDTTKLANGVHTIAWSVVDNAGHEQGIGSRYFEVLNLGAASSGMLDARLLQEDRTGLLQVRIEGETGIEVEELGYVEVKLEGAGGDLFAGWGEDVTKSLPTGSTLDEGKGVFRWLVGPGFLGRHVLHFAARSGNTVSRPVEVTVLIRPKTYDRPKHRRGN